MIVNTLEDWVTLFLVLCMGHFLADFPLQGDFVSRYKNHNTSCVMGKIWPWVLASHSAVHALVVYLICGNIGLALLEGTIHTFIDHSKCSGKLTFNQDQCLHILTKLVLVGLAWFWALRVTLPY